MLQKLELHHFRAFERFTVSFGPDAFLVGANNAGKTTIVTAARAVARMLNIAKNRKPDGRAIDAGRSFPVYRFSNQSVDLDVENLRHEFRNQETRIQATFKSQAVLTAIWPGASPEQEIWDVDPYFYVTVKDRSQPTTPKAVRDIFPTVGVIPVLAPVEAVETQLGEKYVREHVDSRLASRHFRNQLNLLEAERWPWQGTFEAYLAHLEDWAHEISLGTPRLRVASDGVELDVFHTEEGSRSERELSWAGDGLQVWLQLLFHMYRLSGASTVILDEPDLYLHPDLERRLVHLLETHTAQTVTATHSPEVLAEANPESVIWVDKTKKRARRGPKAAELGNLSTTLGSQFNLRVAKALRSKAVLFVEGKDMRIFRTLAKKVGAERVANERGITVVPLEGYSNWRNIAPFSWLVNNLLEESVHLAVALDRDYRPDEAVEDVKSKLKDVGVDCHVWNRKELENYLLVSSAIARVSGADAEVIIEKLEKISESQRTHVLARRNDAAQDYLVDRHKHRVTVMEEAQEKFERLWESEDRRLELVPAKETLAALNVWLQSEGFKPVSSRAIAASMTANEIPAEMAEFLEDLEARIAE